MNAELGLFAPSLPAFLLYPVAGLSAIIILYVMGRTRDRAASFVIGAAWLRYVMSAFHTVTYRPLLAGMSANAVASIGIFLVGLLAIDWRHLALRFLGPVYIVIGIAVLSAVVNGNIGGGLITVVTKFGYFIVVMLSVYGAMTRAKNGAFLSSFLWAFAPVLVFQALSVAFDVSKRTETDINATSFIGGYNHEAVFSVILATCLTVACFTDRLNKTIKNGIILACIVGILLANYRTTLVAIAPLLLMYFGFSTLQRFPQRDRPFVVSGLIVTIAIALGLVSLLFAERFQDVTFAASGHVNFFKPPEQYTVDETRLLSGRPRIWSMYIYAWLRGDTMNHLIGFGPESWSLRFPLYAHNTLVNQLFEYGIVGVVGLLLLWFSMLSSALRIRHPHRGVVVGAHLSFLMLNMSTMPMWMIEGNILYGVICGYTLYLLSLKSRAQNAQPGQPAPPQRRARRG